MGLKPSELPAVTVSGATVSQPFHLRRLFAARHTETIEANEALFHETEPGYLFEIVSGCVRRYTMRCDGRRSIVAFSFEGDYCGHLLAEASALSAEAVTPLTVRRIGWAQLRAVLATEPPIEGELLQLARRELETTREHVALLGSNRAISKVASFLLSCAERLPSQDAEAHVLSLPMRRLDIADFLGLTIESVSRALTQLRLDGCISLKASNEVILEDTAALRQIADELPRDERGRMCRQGADASGDVCHSGVFIRSKCAAKRSNSSASSSHL
jgi:CRP/FNR family transcriptional regulator